MSLGGFHLGDLGSRFTLGNGLDFPWTPRTDDNGALLSPELGFHSAGGGIAGDVGEASSDRRADTQGAALAAQEKRGRETDVSAACALGDVLSLTTSRHAHRVLDPTDEKFGLVSTNVAHTLNLQLSQSMKLTAAMKQQGDAGEATPDRLDEEDREQRIELATRFGGREDNSLRVAMISLSSHRDGEEATRRKTEAHLTVVPTTGLRLRVDHLTARGDNGQVESGASVDASFDLGAQTKLTGHLKRKTTATASNREQGISLASAFKYGRLTSEQKQTRGSNGTQTFLKHAFSGGFGDGSARANVKATFEQMRSEGVDGQRRGLRSLHVDRQLAPAMRLSVDWQSKEGGTNGEPTHENLTTCQVQARAFGGGELEGKLSHGRASDGTPIRGRKLVFSRKWEPVKLRLTQSSCHEGAREDLITAAYVDVQTAALPAWMSAVPVATQLEDAGKYLRRPSERWESPDMSFVGYRVWAAHRDAAGENERDTFGFAHGRILGEKHYVQLVIERCPAATRGAETGEAQPRQRYSLETTIPLSEAVRASCGYGVQTSLVEEQDRLQRASFGLSSIRPSNETYHVDIAYESGRWEGAEASQTSITLLYSRHVGEDDQVEVKLRQTWGEGIDATGGGDCRLAFTYSKPI
ncbi:MAG: hypothetical protein JXA57_10585 [Armatimonadetes bacterium]|nr:hypothetical protein [Armatimonadota bacterium]